MSFLSYQKIVGYLGAPSHIGFFPKSTDQNFEIAILFYIVENHNNYVFGDDLLPHSPWEGLQVTNFDQCFTYSNGYWEVYRRFQGDSFGLGGGLRGGELAMWEDLSLEEYVVGGREIQ